MNTPTIRIATINDVPFLVDTIIAAEKSGTDKLTYSTIFGISEDNTRKYLADMLAEEVDGCELSISSCLMAEVDGQAVAAVAAWIEGKEGIPSTVLKGNLLNYILPKEALSKGLLLNPILKELRIEYLPDTIQFGLAYVLSEFRGNNLAGILIEEQISRLSHDHPEISECYLQVYGSNVPAIRAYERIGFKTVFIKESTNIDILDYMPSKSKILMKRDINII
jgi:ribosomal protein S18 acetylase RimI-like enzyme